MLSMGTSSSAQSSPMLTSVTRNYTGSSKFFINLGSGKFVGPTPSASTGMQLSKTLALTESIICTTGSQLGYGGYPKGPPDPSHGRVGVDKVPWPQRRHHVSKPTLYRASKLSLPGSDLRQVGQICCIAQPLMLSAPQLLQESTRCFQLDRAEIVVLLLQVTQEAHIDPLLF